MFVLYYGIIPNCFIPSSFHVGCCVFDAFRIGSIETSNHPIDLVPGTDDVDLAFEMIRIGTQCCYVIQQTTYAQRQFGGTEEKECQLVTFTLFII